MTRFTRAKGSKASNERLPEQATSWYEMKQDLLKKNKESEEKQQREEALKRRSENYQAFLQEKEVEEDSKVTWAEFQDAGHNLNHKRKDNSSPKSHSKKMKFDSPKTNNISNKAGELISEESDSELNTLKLKIEDILKKENKAKVESESDSDSPPDVVGIKEQPKEIEIKKVKNKKPKIQISLNGHKNSSDASTKEDNIEVNGKDIILTDKDKKKIEKKKQRNLKRLEKKKRLRQEKRNLKMQEVNTSNNSKPTDIQSSNKDNLNEQDLLKIEKKKEKRIRQIEKKKKFKEANLQNNEVSNKTNESDNINTSKTNLSFKAENGKNQKRMKEQKKIKNRDSKDHKRKKPVSETVMINGKSVEIGFVDGFPVKKEDADRLKQLRREMITKGLPRSEIDIALKLERRRAEKALAREKKNVCFNCRMSGHVLSECPELGKDQIAQSGGTGICFKCGSTEHSHFECKVVKGMDYKFAQCFICNEQGHIARQCPDNQRGLYPKGGSCNVCGDVTHLKKDCPKYQAQQAQLKDSFNIGTLTNSNPDDLAGTDSINTVRATKKPLNKVIKF